MYDAATHKRVALSGGGTGGHLYPGLALAERLRQSGYELLYVGSARGLEADVVPAHGMDFVPVPSRGVVGSPLKKAWSLIVLAWGTLKVLAVFKRWRPNLVVGTGGFVCVPSVLAARLLGVPTVILEQNAIPGKATNLLSKVAAAVCVSFERSLDAFAGARVIWTGNPLRQSMEPMAKSMAREALGLDVSRPTLLVVGASQGARSMNEALLSALKHWKSRDWNILHITGRSHLGRVKARVEGIMLGGASVTYRALGFAENMATLYSAADLIVSRAGATSIAEITHLGRPAILVPYPFAGGHQIENAKLLVDSGAGVVIPDAEIGVRLQAEVEALLMDSLTLEKMADASSLCGQPQATQNVFDVCCEVMK